MKKILVLMMLAAMLLTGCGIEELSEDILKGLYEDELGMEITSLDILNMETEDKSSRAEVYIIIEDQDEGIRGENVAEAHCIYSEDSESWILHESKINEDNWKITPLYSSLTKGTGVIDDYLWNHSIALVNDIGISGSSDKIVYSDPESVELDLEAGYERITFGIELDFGDLYGETEVSAEVNFRGEDWVITSVDYEPIDMQWKNGCPIDLSQGSIVEMFTANYPNGLLVGSGQRIAAIEGATISEITIVEEPFLAETDYGLVVAVVNVKGKYGLVEYDSNVNLVFENSGGSWRVHNMNANGYNPEILLSDELLGTWKGIYILSNNKRSGEIRITNCRAEDGYYEGVFSFGSSDTYQTESGSYEVVLDLKLPSQSIAMDAGKWIDKPRGYFTLDFELEFDGANTLSGHPDSLFSNSSNYAEFVRVQ